MGEGSRKNGWIRSAAAVALVAVVAIGAALVLTGRVVWPDGEDGKGVALAERSELAAFARGPLRNLQAPAEPAAPPDYVFRDAEGAEARFSDYRGRVVVVNLWAMWCRPCRTEMPTLAILAERYRDADLLVLPINVDRTEDEIAEAREFLAVHEPLTFASDPAFELPFRFPGRGAMPQTIVIDRQGRVRATLAGESDWASAEARALIDHLLAEEA